jgi:hypothetical protein
LQCLHLGGLWRPVRNLHRRNLHGRQQITRHCHHRTQAALIHFWRNRHGQHRILRHSNHSLRSFLLPRRRDLRKREQIPHHGRRLRHTVLVPVPSTCPTTPLTLAHSGIHSLRRQTSTTPKPSTASATLKASIPAVELATPQAGTHASHIIRWILPNN